MELWRALKRLWVRDEFRRLLVLRLTAQTADGTLQVGMASYVLFSPQSQPDAGAIAAVLAISLLPFTLLGPFVSPLLDRWSRRDVALWSNVIRAVLTLIIAGIVFVNWTSGAGTTTLMVLLLVALSLNRFMLAGLSAGMHHTVSPREYLSASSIIPMVGPLGVVVGGAVGLGIRLVLGRFVPTHVADAVIFVVAAAVFVWSALAATTFSRGALGPDDQEELPSMRHVLRGLGAASAHLWQRKSALLGLVDMAVTRFLFGLVSVALILVARNRWHPVTEPDAALVDLGVWGAMTGAGFLLAAVVVPSSVSRVGLRTTLVALLSLGAASTLVVTFSDGRWVLFGMSFVVGLVTQAVKVCVDGLVHAHIDETYKGRVFTFYDMGFNGAYVLAAVVAMFALPADGVSSPAFAAMTALFVVLAALTAWGAARITVAEFERGSEDLART
uniref:MFS transporter n=1 Tax=Tessaracoccus timonensis TaxID=2161816 RepID=UPI000D556270|nr:MFS transporter [Tessaracoccus timonensis]